MDILNTLSERIHNLYYNLTLPNLYKTQYWPLKRLEEFQNNKLKEIITYTYKSIPGYRKKFQKYGIKPSHINSLKDLSKIPITTREELQQNPEFVNEQLISGTLYTGGSTGVPLKYYESKESGKIRWQSHLRGWSWNGYTPGKRIAVISSAQGFVGSNNTLNLIGDLTTENLKRNIEKIINFKPEFLRGYVGSLYILARYCLDNDIVISGIKSIDPISENLYSYQRHVIEKAFNAPVFEEYVCNDGGACAWECEKHNGLHYFMERAIIEVVNGEMVVTDLWNKAMPFIRYKNGDLVKFLNKKCSCGRNLPLITVKGRANDLLITNKGVISPSFLVHHGIGLVGADKMKSNFKSGIRALQYIQKPGYQLQVNIVKNPWCTKRDIKYFLKKLRSIAGNLKIELTFVNDIPKTKKGKRQFIINEDKALLKKWSCNGYH